MLSTLRLAFARYTWLRRLAVVLPAVLAGLTVWMAIRSVSEEQSRWSTTVDVVVATDQLRPGDRLRPSVVQTKRWPAALVPDRALTELDGPATVRQRVSAGSVLTDDDIGRGEGTSALMSDGQRGVVIPSDLPVSVGDTVGVVVAGDELALGTVVGINDGSAVVALPAAAAGRAADATLLGTVTLVAAPR